MLERVIPTSRFEDDIDRLRVDYPRIDEVRIAAMWELTRKPYAGEPLPDYPRIYIFLTHPIYPMPVFRILYTFKEAQKPIVILQTIGPSTGEVEIPF